MQNGLLVEIKLDFVMIMICEQCRILYNRKEGSGELSF